MANSVVVKNWQLIMIVIAGVLLASVITYYTRKALLKSAEALSKTDNISDAIQMASAPSSGASASSGTAEVPNTTSDTTA